MERYILSIDQSTSATKALLFDSGGSLVARADQSHRQLVDEQGWVEHDPQEIYRNVLETVEEVVQMAGIGKEQILGVGISNQRETALIWDRDSGRPMYNAIVWQCGRGRELCQQLEQQGAAQPIKSITGLNLSPYFSAAKIAWLLNNVPGLEKEKLCGGTMDSWLIYRLTGGKSFLTDYSNASRTQLFDLVNLCWSDEVCGYFGIDASMLAAVVPSDSCFGETDFDGFLPKPIPIHSVMGDSHGALFGQGCHRPGDIKATYGTGSSVMMNVGEAPVFSDTGIVSSIGWAMGEKISYVLEGNINYTGAVMKWVTDDLGLIASPKEAEELSASANPEDQSYLVPAFSGLGAPYWDSDARAILCGMTRTTGKAEIVRAANDCIAYQITDVVDLIQKAADIPINSLRVDGGPTRDRYLMQFQCDLLNRPVEVPDVEELSGIGPAYAAGMALGLYDKDALFCQINRTIYSPTMDNKVREHKIWGWKDALQRAMSL